MSYADEIDRIAGKPSADNPGSQLVSNLRLALAEAKRLTEELADALQGVVERGTDSPEHMAAEAALEKAGRYYDPTPWCHQCGAKTAELCKCGPIADNN